MYGGTARVREDVALILESLGRTGQAGRVEEPGRNLRLSSCFTGMFFDSARLYSTAKHGQARPSTATQSHPVLLVGGMHDPQHLSEGHAGMRVIRVFVP